MITLDELGKILEPEFDKADRRESRKFSKIAGSDESTETKIDLEAELVKHCLQNSRGMFDNLLTNHLKLEYVGQNVQVDEKNVDGIANIALQIYEDSLMAMHLERNIQLLEDPTLRKKDPEIYDINQAASVKTLKQKIRAHFTVAELLTALKVRIKSQEPRSPIGEYVKVVQEGAIMDDKLYDNGKYPLIRVRLALDIGTSYKRLYDLDKNEMNPHKTRANMLVEAKSWLWRMFDINIHNKYPIERVLPTEYEFKRYIKDVKDSGVGCVFMNYNQDQTFGCGKKASAQGACQYNSNEYCNIHADDKNARKDLLVRAKFDLEI